MECALWVDLPLTGLIPIWSAPHAGSHTKYTHTSRTMQEHYQRLSGVISAATCHNTTARESFWIFGRIVHHSVTTHPHSVVAFEC